jgi:hypothetical protein
MSIHAPSLPDQLFVPAKALQYYWALGIDSMTNRIYVGDPKGFIQRGSVGVYAADGSWLKSFDVNLGPGYFYFDY